MTDEIKDFNKTQQYELWMAVRHIGRAMSALNRAKIPAPPRLGNTPDWLCDLYEAEEAVREASNKLIDGLEKYDARK